MRILFLFCEGFDTPGPSNHLMKALVEDTLAAGHDVAMIESCRNPAVGSIPAEWAGHTGLSVFTVPLHSVPKNRFALRYLELVRYAFYARRVWRKLGGADVVFVQSCPTAVFPIKMLRADLNAKIIYNIQDMFPGSSVASGVMKSRIQREVFMRLQKIAYKKSDRITVISEDMRQKVLEQGVAEDKVRVIVNWYDDRTVREVGWEENRFAAKYGLRPDSFYVQYAGTMGYVFDYEMVLAAAERLRGYRDIVFQMIGTGSQKGVFMTAVREKKLDNIVFYPLEPQEMVSDVYSACDLCLIPLKRGVIGNSVPSKAALLMACRRAIINSVDETSDYYRVFNENNIGLSVSNTSPDDVAGAILSLYQNPDVCELYASNGKAYGEKFYSRKVNTESYIDLFVELNGKK